MLQTAEARASEASHQAALNRVRAEIASMRSADDLDHITPLIWKELVNLAGFPSSDAGFLSSVRLNGW